MLVKVATGGWPSVGFTLVGGFALSRQKRLMIEIRFIKYQISSSYMYRRIRFRVYSLIAGVLINKNNEKILWSVRWPGITCRSELSSGFFIRLKHGKGLRGRQVGLATETESWYWARQCFWRDFVFAGGMWTCVISTSILKLICYFEEIYIAGYIESCQINNFCCSQWCKFHQNNDRFVLLKAIERLNHSDKTNPPMR